MRVERVPGLAGLGEEVASALLDVCAARQAEGAVPCVVLTGGRAGAEVLRALGRHPRLGAVDWGRVRLLWGDERWLPSGDPERNDRLADDLLFGAATPDPRLVHRVAAPEPAGGGAHRRGDGGPGATGLDDAAAAYAALVAGLGRIDLALCGVGEDGHVASLFPGREELLRDDPATPAALAVRDSPKPPPERVSLSLPALRRAERVWLLASGSGKADAVRGLVAGDPALPAARLRGRSETVLWADPEALAGAAE